MAQSLNTAAHRATQRGRNNCILATTTCCHLAVFVSAAQQSFASFALAKEPSFVITELSDLIGCKPIRLVLNQVAIAQFNVLLNAVDRNLLICKAQSPSCLKHHKYQKVL